MPVSLSLCPLHDAARLPAGAVVIARDVTEQHLAQAMLAEIEARLEEGEAMAHVGSWLWDLRTGAVQWSAEFHRIHGLDPVDFAGTFGSHLAVVHPDDRDRLQSVMERSVASQRPFETEYRVVRPDGLVSLLRVRAQPTVGSAGVTVGIAGDRSGHHRTGPPPTSFPPYESPDSGDEVATGFGNGAVAVDHRRQLAEPGAHLGAGGRHDVGELVGVAEGLERLGSAGRGPCPRCLAPIT